MYAGCPLRDKRVVVTGGCGFIGSHLVEAMWRDNHVVAVDNLASGTESNLNGFDVDFIRYDIVGGLDDVFAGADVNLIREATGFQAQTSPGRGLDDYVAWLTKDVGQPWEAPVIATPAE